MDRVNRRFLLASTLLAIPTALLMVSFSTGTAPDVQLAVGQASDDSGAIQQVVGKQPHSPQTRPGLLQVISGSRSKGSQNHRHQNMPEVEPKGLLDALFDGRSSSRSSSSHKSSNHKSSSRTSGKAGVTHHDYLGGGANPPSRTAAKSTSRSTGSDSGVNWDGIPYHRAQSSSGSTASAPIRDPSQRSASSSGSTRIIRGGSSRTIQAKPASVRRPSEPTIARAPTPALLVPEPPKELESTRSSQRDLSSSSSSRRRSRRNVQSLDASEIAAASRSSVPKPAELDDEVSDLVPKVVRKEAAAEEKKPEPKAAEKPAPEAVAKQEPAAEKQEAVEEKRVDVPGPADDPETRTALAAIGTPTPSDVSSQEPESAGDVAPSTPTANLHVPPANPQPAYTQPVDPATSPIPVAGIPSHPYAASTPAPAMPNTAIAGTLTPAAPASHRTGPPRDAFGPGQIAGVPPGQAPQAQPRFNAASTPVGSGVVPNGDVASYRRPTHPGYQPVQQPSFPNADPYANQGYPSKRMTTYGQPVANRSISTPTGARPTHETAAVPMQPINTAVPYANGAAQQATDNFARSTYDSRNQMRDAAAGAQSTTSAAASELPGIRVATYGPSAIMIRQTSQYEIRVENRGSIDATGVLVRALIPDWADIRGQNATRGDIDTQVQGSRERLVWTIDNLPAGASEQMFVRLTAERSGTYDLDVDWTLVPQKSVAKVQVREPLLDLTIEGPDEVVYGQSQTYKVRVLNPGDGTAPNVVFTLSPNSATPQTQRIGDIPPGKEAQFDVELTAQDLGDLKIHGLASGDLELRAESAKTIRVAAAKLEAILTGPELKYQNNEAMYSLQLQNNGAATSEKIVATLRLPSGVTYLGGIEEAVVQGGVLKWDINALAPGATRNYQFRCNMMTTGEHLFAFDCKGTAAGNTDVSIATRVESIADLVLSVSDPTAPAPIGSDVMYEIIIRNRGSKEATDVRAVAQFSHGIEPQRIEGQSGEVVTGQVLFDAIPRIGAGQEVRMRVIAQADRAGHHRFRTEVRSGDTVLVAEEATHYMSPKSDRVSRRSSDSARSR